MLREAQTSSTHEEQDACGQPCCIQKQPERYSAIGQYLQQLHREEDPHACGVRETTFGYVLALLRGKN